MSSLRHPSTLVASVLAMLLMAFTPPAGADHGILPIGGSGAEVQDLNLRRWFGGEAGPVETGCWNPGTGVGCFSLSGTTGFGGEVTSEKSHALHRDADGVDRMWPSRTGLRHFWMNAPGGTPSFAYVSTLGGNQASTSPMTLAFGLRFHTLPVQPIVVYRHLGTSPDQTILVTLTPEGALGLSAAGFLAFTPPLGREQWHSVSIWYGSKPGTSIQLKVDSFAALNGILPLGGPGGQIDLGIVSPTTSPYSLAIDDYVESGVLGAPIHAARINYLMPLGTAGAEGWTKVYPVESCRKAARNWQLVSENQYVAAEDVLPGIPGICGMEGGALTTSLPSVIDDYDLEGVPSKHKPVEGYGRDVTIQPTASSTVLGVRVRIRARTEGNAVAIPLSLIDQGTPLTHTFPFATTTSSGYAVSWSPTWTTRPKGGPWTAATLNPLRMRLDSGLGVGPRSVSGVRLDYVWVP